MVSNMPPSLYSRIAGLRLPFLYAMALLTVVAAKGPLAWQWGALILFGALVRIWAAGHICKNELLAASGPYAYVRHPLYLGSFLSALGIFFMIGRPALTVLFAAGFALFYGCKIWCEEVFLSSKFGAGYSSYRQRVPAFFPNPFKIWGKTPYAFSIRKAIQNGEIKSLACTAAQTALVFLAAGLRQP
ncbi:MAG TPA: hypothetical protein DCL60_06905 [Armatimonadetes bacterium]|jgi:protein-S-isoprenylcysteine O-methyltransferase Ste14|nr:hypothetical protein [Armatimonadota bacterium]